MGQHRFVALDSMRGICAVMVAIYHLSAVSYVNSLPFIKNGFLFVDFFFALSGFVIASSYQDKLLNDLPISRFMFLRIARLYPLHLFMLLLYLGVAILRPMDYSASGFVITALLLQTFSDGNLTNWNLPSWSISAEMWTYLSFAVICVYLPWRVPALLSTIAIAPIFLFNFTDRYLDVCFTGSLARCLYGFSIGVLCFDLWRIHRLRLTKATHTILEVMVLAACFLLVGAAGAGPLSLMCPFVFGATLFVFASERGHLSRLLTVRAIALLGTLSYSIYMTHTFIQARLLNLIGITSGRFSLPVLKQAGGTQTLINAAGFNFATDIAVMIMIIAVLAVSALTFLYVEEPIRRRSKRSSIFLATITAPSSAPTGRRRQPDQSLRKS